MKPLRQDLIIVTATTDFDRSRDCLQSWQDKALLRVPIVIVANGGATGDPSGCGSGVTIEFYSGDYLGVVPAFAKGVELALKTGADIIACFHDDLEILEQNWDQKVVDHFAEHPKCGLAGFGGGKGLGAEEIYKTPYDPMQLARQGFVSNMRDALAHGAKKTCSCRVACLDGFSQIGRGEYWQPGWVDLFTLMKRLGIVHHAYDAALGCYAKRHGWEAWMIPVHCHHHGGMTAVADAGYNEWASQKIDGGDQAFWKTAHELVYKEFKDVLPIRT